MKVVFWFLTAVIAGLLAFTIKETKQLQDAHAELEKATERQAAVQSKLWQIQRQQLASARGSATPASAPQP